MLYNAKWYDARIYGNINGIYENVEELRSKNCSALQSTGRTALDVIKYVVKHAQKLWLWQRRE